MRFRRNTGLPKLQCSYREVKETVAKVLFCSDDEEELLAVGDALRAHPLAGDFSFVRSEKSLFEILPKGVQKGLAMEKIASHLGVEHRRVIAVGDYDNDVGMLREAGLGIAVENASPAAKAAAKSITVSNEAHALAQIIADLEEKRIVL